MELPGRQSAASTQAQRHCGPGQRRKNGLFKLGQLHASHVLQVSLKGKKTIVWTDSLCGFTNTSSRYPVIAIIVVGGLIVFSVVWCIARCLCCGLSCCCECCQFFKCCGNCCGCCDPPRGKRSKYLDEPYIPPSQGYKMQPPMNPHFPAAVPTMTPAHTGFSSGVTTGVTPATSHYADTPQYAEFDVSKPKGGEDALPAMPSWESAGKKKIMLEEEDAVELDQLKKPEASGQNAQNGALLTGAAAVLSSTSPIGSPGNHSPYGPPPGNPANNGYYPAPATRTDPYAQGARDNYSQPGGG